MCGAFVSIMKWLRSNAKRLSVLALFALALQFGLSFGHIHADHAFAAPAAVSHHASLSTPENGHHQDDPADVCAICATVAMANALVDAAPPVLPSPLDTNAVVVFADRASHVTTPRLTAFQSRAPPRS